jgi:hypothetical protein
MQRLLNLICILLFALFIYAALSKLLQFNTFREQLGKSPLIPAGWQALVAVLVPLGELTIAAALFLPRFQLYGLLASFFLMTLFTIYLFYIVRYSYYVPCSCGGILGKLSWTEHIYFNLFFILISFAGVLICKPDRTLYEKV